MPAQRLAHDALGELFQRQKEAQHGSVFLTQKCLSYGDMDTETSNVIIRATNGKHGPEKIKLSTVVAPPDLGAFYARYAEVCKGGMAGLKKRDRSGHKAKKKKQKQHERGQGVP